MHKIILSIAALILLSPSGVHASEYIQKHIPQAEKVGEGRLSYLVWDVYDAALYAPQGQWNNGRPYALKLSYLMDLKGDKIADRSAEEMRKQKLANEVELATWHTQMTKIFPNVSAGTTITGVYTQNGNTVFYKNGSEIGRIQDQAFSKAFFGIWLNKQTSSPDLRQKLLGNATSKMAQNQSQ